MTITVVFDPPLPSDSPSTFNAKAFTLLGDLNTWSTQANAMPASFASSVSTALASPPAIGGTTPNAVTATTLTATSGLFGYGTGAGGTVTQATNNFTGVTLHKPAGRITMSGVSLPGNSTCYFTLTNSFISTTDIVLVQQINNSADLLPHVVNSAAGSCTIVVRNLSATAYNTAIVLQFEVFKGAAS